MEKVYCPVDDWECPYYQKDGSCTLENATEECDAFWDGDYLEEEEY